MPASHTAKKRVLLRDEVNEAAVKDEDVGMAVVVVVVDAGAPADVLRVGLRDAIGGADVLKALLPLVPQQPVVVAIGNPQVKRPAAFQIGEYGAHRRSRFAVLAECRACLVADLFKCAVMLVVEEKILRPVVGDIDVVPAVVVKVGSRHAHFAPNERGNAGLLAHVRKRRVAVVVKELAGLALVVQRAWVVIGGVVIPVLGIELEISANEQIHAAVPVVIQPGGTDGPAIHLDAGLGCDVGEVAVAVVVIQDRLAVARDEQVDKAIVVVVGRGDGHRVHIWIQAGLGSHIREVAVAVVAIEVIVGWNSR